PRRARRHRGRARAPRGHGPRQGPRARGAAQRRARRGRRVARRVLRRRSPGARGSGALLSEPAASRVRVGLPSKGSLSEPMFAFLKECGLAVERESSRSYTARFKNVEGVEVTFLRAPEIVERVLSGELELGLTGRDLYEEAQAEATERDAAAREGVLVVEDLGFGRVDLLLAVPEGWLDVEGLDDLRTLCRERGEEGRALRIATKFARLTRVFLDARGVR